MGSTVGFEISISPNPASWRQIAAWMVCLERIEYRWKSEKVSCQLKKKPRNPFAETKGSHFGGVLGIGGVRGGWDPSKFAD